MTAESADTGPTAEVFDSGSTEVGGLAVHRSLPKRQRRQVGAWCFLDRFGPHDVSPTRAMEVGPHPHIGLHTVTWLLSGEVEHTDSLGSRQMIRPGQLNLMTAGQGIAHAEDGRHQTDGVLDGVQLWVAQPEATRHGPSAFEHHADLPVVDLGRATATILLGTFGPETSPARIDTPLVGVELSGSGAITFGVESAFEYGVAVLNGTVGVLGTTAALNQFMYIPPGHDHLELELARDTRLMLLGGVPFDEEILMWWNFVARDRSEMDQVYADWQAGSDRFGAVASTLERIPAPRPYWHTQ